MSHERGRVVVWLEGELDVATVPAVAAVLASVTSTGDGDVVVDLGAVTFFGAAALGVIARAASLLSHRARTLTLRGPSKHALHVIELCGMGQIVERASAEPAVTARSGGAPSERA